MNLGLEKLGRSRVRRVVGCLATGGPGVGWVGDRAVKTSSEMSLYLWGWESVVVDIRRIFGQISHYRLFGSILIWAESSET